MSEQKKIDISRVSSEDIQDLFEKKFDELAPLIDINSFEVSCDRNIETRKATVNVNVYGTAGAPTIDQFRQDKIKEARSISIERFDIGTLVFNLLPTKTVFMNSNDYQLVYESV